MGQAAIDYFQTKNTFIWFFQGFNVGVPQQGGRTRPGRRRQQRGRRRRRRRNKLQKQQSLEKCLNVRSFQLRFLLRRGVVVSIVGYNTFNYLYFYSD
jgi:hypothetical protein